MGSGQQRLLSDFSPVDNKVKDIAKAKVLSEPSHAFYFLVLDLLLKLQEDEIEDSITDTSYLLHTGKSGGHDRGIDAIYIDGSETPNKIHVFNCKYTSIFDKADNFFPSNEIDKILSFIDALQQKDKSLKSELNYYLFQKVEEIWKLYEDSTPNIIIHIGSNFYNGFEASERIRFEKGINKYSNVKAEYHTLPDLVAKLVNKDISSVNGKIKAIDTRYFEKSEGDIRALIVNVDIRDLIRIVLNDENIRNNVSLEDYTTLKNYQIFEDAFEDNVRIYLKQRSKINRNIKETILSEESQNFFYYNNGITITCKNFSYPKKTRAPIIELEGLQIVNGGQTIHAVYEGLTEDPSKFNEYIEVLCRIYQTENKILGTHIAEYTNSQNAVKSRDIRSNDYIQKKLEKDLETYGIFYERKKGYFASKKKEEKIDAEKAGQVLMALFSKMPGVAKDNKKMIFAEMYDQVFHDNLTANDLLVASRLYDYIEDIKNEKKPHILKNKAIFEKESYLLHSTLYVLYLIGELATKQDIELKIENMIELTDLYPEAIKLIENSIQREKIRLEKLNEVYNDRVYFKGNRPMTHIQMLLEESLSYMKIIYCFLK